MPLDAADLVPAADFFARIPALSFSAGHCGTRDDVLIVASRLPCDDSDARRTERMPNMVLVLPVPGGPWMSVTPRPHRQVRIASSCDGLCVDSMALSSVGGGWSDGGGAEPSVPPGASRRWERASSRSE